MEPGPLDRMWSRSRGSARSRVARLKSKRWQIIQCALAAGVAWLIASDLLGHQTPFFAPVAAVVSLGTSYGQRLRRVLEVTIGVAVGVLLADLLVQQIGSGWWQLTIIVGLAMSLAFLLDGGQLLVTQAAVQSIVVSTLLPDPGAGLTRWTDALVGGGVALLAATAVPAAPLRRPREQAAVVVRKIAQLLRAAGEVMVDGEVDRAMALLADARSTDYLIRELQDAADEGLSVVASSPFRVRHKGNLRRMVELVDPLDRALRSTRVLVRQTAVAAYHRRAVPGSYSLLALDLADAADQVADELASDQMAVGARTTLLAVGQATGTVERTDELAAEVVLAQLRSVVVDLLLLTGLDQMESTDALPPPPR
ncbi:aromatic acid exporter family protein [Nocardioides sp. KIGAM211]|uniref:Aromatic acid exporter family protein n=1 Tax=Nocardioides luti TaxID=2761101 RepID=A0A7X0RFA9_9ACTN|nr:FUSC family protein [Nocardioides luti]MBB6627115.1 aromatic acid exporter family protein [Nocardioides luti]